MKTTNLFYISCQASNNINNNNNNRNNNNNDNNQNNNNVNVANLASQQMNMNMVMVGRRIQHDDVTNDVTDDKTVFAKLRSLGQNIFSNGLGKLFCISVQLKL